MKVYFDTCALSRLTDNPTHPRIERESAAVQTILRLVASGLFEWSASTILVREISRNPNAEKRAVVLSLLPFDAELIEP